jgi:hypothetical protein
MAGALHREPLDETGRTGVSDAERDSRTRMITPGVMEIVARRG